jgi:hypothetical protein
MKMTMKTVTKDFDYIQNIAIKIISYEPKNFITKIILATDVSNY